MSAAQFTVKQSSDRVLQETINQQRRLVLTHHSPQGWRTFKAVFVSRCESSRTILVKTQLPSGTASPAVPQPEDTLGVTFRVGRKKCMFTTTVVSMERWGEEGVVALRWPDHIHQLQRRVYERAKPPKEMVISVCLCRAESLSGSPADRLAGLSARTVCHGQLEDLSAGGMRVRVVDALYFQLGSTYRCVFAPRPGRPSLVVDALVRHHEAVEHGRATIGFQFVGLESSAEGQRALDRLARTVSQFQRARSRKRQ